MVFVYLLMFQFELWSFLLNSLLWSMIFFDSFMGPKTIKSIKGKTNEIAFLDMN